MKVGFSQLNFCATPLFNIKLKKRINNAYQNVDARVSELNPNDGIDKNLMDELEQKWNADADPFSILGIIKMNFDNFVGVDKDKILMSYYITELVSNDKKTSIPNITSIIELKKPTSENDNILYINSLQSNPDFSKEYIPSIKGAGELAMYAAVKLAKMFSAKNILLDSCENGFYKQIGMTQANNDSIFTLDSKDYDTFIKRVEDKYSFVS